MIGNIEAASSSNSLNVNATFDFFPTEANFAKLIGKHLYQNLFLNKVAGLRPATLLKKRFWHRCFPVNFTKFLRTPFLQNISRRLLLSLGQCRNHCTCCNQLPSYRLLRPFVALNYNFWISSHFFLKQNYHLIRSIKF